MPKTEGRGSSGRLTELELMGEMGGNISSVITPTPASQGSPKTTFDCPLCVEFFWQFSQLKRHLLYMHPRRDMIMKLVKERYGDSKRQKETSTSSALDAQMTHELSTSLRQTSKKFHPTVERVEATTSTFKIPLVPQLQTVAKNRPFKKRSHPPHEDHFIS